MLGFFRNGAKKPVPATPDARIAELEKSLAEKDKQLTEQAQTLTDIQLGMAELYESITT